MQPLQPPYKSYLCKMVEHKTIMFAASPEKAMKGFRQWLADIPITDFVTVEPCECNFGMDLGVKI